MSVSMWSPLSILGYQDSLQRVFSWLFRKFFCILIVIPVWSWECVCSASTYTTAIFNLLANVFIVGASNQNHPEKPTPPPQNQTHTKYMINVSCFKLPFLEKILLLCIVATRWRLDSKDGNVKDAIMRGKINIS
uniref:Uncharacterized protein n=1 Tax=Myotis myotis TaxID=51298 RepID=A0A7J7SBZ6_MYOMY|nr:hypothetical protein mMyoMyo1_009459 [Myotis myotis]